MKIVDFETYFLITPLLLLCWTLKLLALIIEKCMWLPICKIHNYIWDKICARSGQLLDKEETKLD